MKIDTPVATMGIRGTAVLVEIEFEVPGAGRCAAGEIPGAGRARWHHRLLRAVRQATLLPIATVNQAGTQTIINGQGAVTFLSSAQLSPDAKKLISDVFSLKFTD